MARGLQQRLLGSCRTDWFRVLTDLQRCGWPNCNVAAYLGAPTSTLTGWKNGSEPNHSDGTRLLTLWQSMTGRSFDERPMVAEMRDSVSSARRHSPR